MNTTNRFLVIPGLKKVKHTTHEEVLAQWAESEADDLGWIQCATEVKGWDSWHDWRGHTMSLLRASERRWVTYQIVDPLPYFREMLIGPYGAWQEPLLDKNLTTFQKAVRTTAFYKKFYNNPKVVSLIKDFPEVTTLMGIFREDLVQTVCVEGHHRIAAAVFAAHQGKPIDFSNREVFINLFVLPASECEFIHTILARGTTKIPPQQL